jgi:glycosyltransferase involved in cell wall biosynthesis
MDRYWRELDQQYQADPTCAWEIRSVLGAAPARSRRAGRMTRIWRKYLDYPWLARRAVARDDAQIIHVLDHSFAHILPWLPAAAGTRKIVTVHDLGPLHEPDKLTRLQRKRFRRRMESLRLADLLLADSEFTRRDVTAVLGIPAEKFIVLPLGVDYERFSRVRAGPPPEWRQRLAGRKAILSIGAAIGRKNLGILPAIFRALRSLGHPMPALVRIGDRLPAPLSDELREVLGPDGVIETGSASEETLISSYQAADALIFPSRLEGFGLPLLEAMAAGCPVLSSNASSLPEVGGEAALYFSPDDPAAAAAHLARLLPDPAERASRIRLGRQHAAGFDWSVHYKRLTQIYSDAMKSGNAHRPGLMAPNLLTRGSGAR